MNFDGLIFDLDGTLWDCSAASTRAFNLAYQRTGINKKVDRKFIQSISGKTAAECDRIFLEDVPEQNQKQALGYLEQLEIAEIKEETNAALYPGVAAGLKLLKQRYKLFLVSNCTEPYLEVFLKLTCVGGDFSDTECFGRTLQPKAENIKAVVERQKLLFPCYIGDTAGDQNAAEKAKIPFFHLTHGFGENVSCTAAFKNFTELVQYFV